MSMWKKDTPEQIKEALKIANQEIKDLRLELGYWKVTNCIQDSQFAMTWATSIKGVHMRKETVMDWIRDGARKDDLLYGKATPNPD